MGSSYIHFLPKKVKEQFMKDHEWDYDSGPNSITVAAGQKRFFWFSQHFLYFIFFSLISQEERSAI